MPLVINSFRADTHTHAYRHSGQKQFQETRYALAFDCRIWFNYFTLTVHITNYMCMVIKLAVVAFPPESDCSFDTSM